MSHDLKMAKLGLSSKKNLAAVAHDLSIFEIPIFYTKNKNSAVIF